MRLKRFIEYLVPALPIALVMGVMMFPSSCANTTTPPSGGPKDTIPPVMTKMYPAIGDTLIKTHKTEITITCNQYVL